MEGANVSEEFKMVCGSNDLDLSGRSPTNLFKTIQEVEKERTIVIEGDGEGGGDEMREVVPVEASTPKTNNGGGNTSGAGDKGQGVEEQSREANNVMIQIEGGMVEVEEGGGGLEGGNKEDVVNPELGKRNEAWQLWGMRRRKEREEEITARSVKGMQCYKLSLIHI